MKKINNIIFGIIVFCFILGCSDDNNKTESNNEVYPNKIINPVTNFKLESTENENEIKVSWTSPDDRNIDKVQISYSLVGYLAKSTPASVFVEVMPNQDGSFLLLVPTYGTYKVHLKVFSKYGKNSAEVSSEIVPLKPDNFLMPEFLIRAESLLSSMVKNFLGGSYDVWNSSYPNSTGPYWGGAAAVWGQGGAYSGFVATYHAAQNYPYYQQVCEKLENRLMVSLDNFRNTNNGNGKEAYGTYLGSGDERFYDDNAWIALDMIDMYTYTGNGEYLKRVQMVWDFLMQGYDDVCGGGIYWKEGAKSKHTCSTAPVAVLGVKMYLATQQQEYLDVAKDLYRFCKEVLQDPSDYLYYDSAGLTDNSDPNSPLSIDKTKYSYNSGQPMQAAALLYQVTGEEQYKTDAKNIAEACYNRWFQTTYSYILNESFKMLEASGGDRTWFHAIMCRGFFELLKIDSERKYLIAIKKSLENGWNTDARDKELNFMNGDFSGGTTKSYWGIIEEGAILEMLARVSYHDSLDAKN